MAGFNFKRREDINDVFRLIKDAPYSPLKANGSVVDDSLPLTTGWIFRTPSGGIPARSGVVCGSAECTPYYIDENDELVELQDGDGDPQTVAVKHIGSTAITGDTYIMAKEVFLTLVADMEDCG